MLPKPTFSLCVDVTNPGQFFACCGLLELAHRLRPGTEGWFSKEDAVFNVHAPSDEPFTLSSVADSLVKAGIAGELTAEERAELESLETRKSELRKGRKRLPIQDEERRALLGKRQREGALNVGVPFELRVAWWQEDGDALPKTFAGRQEVLRMALAMLSELPKATKADRPFEYRCLLQVAKHDTQQAGEGTRERKQKHDSKVEPFYFDANRFAHALDVGFSLDKQERTIRASAAPLTELLALIGLQRFRPRQTAEDKWMFEYFTWHQPTGVLAASAVTCGTVPMAGQDGYRFRLQFRDDQKRYKAFGFGTRIGGYT